MTKKNKTDPNNHKKPEGLVTNNQVSSNPNVKTHKIDNKEENKNLSITFKKNGRVKVNLIKLFDPTNKGGIEE